MGGLDAHEVRLIDDSGTGDDNLGRIQRVADGGDMGVVASVHLRASVGPGHVLNGSFGVNHRQSGGSVNDATVPTERRVFDIQSDGTRGIHWVDPNVWAAHNVKTRSGCTTINVSVDGYNVGVLGVNSVFTTSEASPANQE